MVLHRVWLLSDDVVSYFDEEPELIKAKKVNGIDLSEFDKKKAVKKMISPDLDETDKACIFGLSVISGANAIFEGAEIVKGTNEVVGGVASAPESAGTGLVIAAKGGIELKKGVEKLDRF